MRTLEKILLLLVALIYFAAIALVGVNLPVTIAAVVLSLLIGGLFAAINRPKTTQEDPLANAGFTGLSLNSPPSEKK